MHKTRFNDEMARSRDSSLQPAKRADLTRVHRSA